MKTGISGLLFLLTVVFTAPASAKCCTVTNVSIGTVVLTTKNGTTHKLVGDSCVKLDKSDFPIKTGDTECSSSGNYAIVTVVGTRCASAVYNHLC